MAQYKAFRTLHGDYGTVAPGQVFNVPDDQRTLRKMNELAAKGLVMRYRPAPDRKAYTVYENKAIQPEANKATTGPIQPPIMRGK